MGKRSAAQVNIVAPKQAMVMVRRYHSLMPFLYCTSLGMAHNTTTGVSFFGTPTIFGTGGTHSLGGSKLQHLTNPTAPGDGATKAYVDAGDGALDKKVDALKGSLSTKEASLLAALATTNAELAKQSGGSSVPRYTYLESYTPTAFPKFIITPYVPVSGIYYLYQNAAVHNDIDNIWRTPGAGFLIQFYHDVCLTQMEITFHAQQDNRGNNWDYASTWQVFDPYGGTLSNPMTLNKGYANPPRLNIPFTKVVATQAIFLNKTKADGSTLPNTLDGVKLKDPTDIFEGINFTTVAKTNPPKWHST